MLELLHSVALVRDVTSSRQTFPWTICRSVGSSVRQSVQCIVGKTADRIRMPFGIIGRTGPGMRHVGLGIGPRKGVLLGANLGRAILTNGDLLSQRRGPLAKLLRTDLLL